MSLTGPTGHPTKWGIPVADIAAGMFAATSVIAALYERHTSGLGRTIDIAMQDCLIAMLTHQATRYLATDMLPPNDYNGHSTIAPYGLFTTADGYVNICVGNDSQYTRMCTVLGFTDLAEDPRYQTNPKRLQHRDELLSALEHRLMERSTRDIIEALESCGVPVGPVRSLDQVFTDAGVQERGMLVTIDVPGHGPARMPNGPWKFDGQSAVARNAPPALGEHTDEVLAEIGVLEGHGIREFAGSVSDKVNS